jgi:hypothetical protein
MQKCFVVAAIILFYMSAGLAQQPDSSPKPGKIPANGNVTELNEYTFGQTADGRVWFIEFYADFCRNCR